jgi:thiol-disulfide isomerase/thioredoxin
VIASRRLAGRILSASLLLALCGLLGGGASLGAQEAWSLPGLEGGALRSSDVASGATVMILFAGWSPHCRDIVARTNAIQQRWGGRARVVLVDFQEEPGEVSGFLAGKGARAPVYLDADGTFAKQHRVTTLPGLVVYRDGEVVFQGKLPDDPQAELARVLS